MNKRGYALSIVIGACFAAGAGFWLASTSTHATHNNVATSSHSAASTVDQVVGFHGTFLKTPRQLAIPEDLKKTDGRPFTIADLKGHWSLMFFGYTRCPDICPTTLSTLVETHKKAGKSFPQVYFVSVDPARDTMKKLTAYVKFFDKDFIGVTGRLSMIKALTLQLGVVFTKVPSKSGNPNDYLINHSTALMLVNPKGALAAIINPPLSPGSIMKAVRVVRKKEPM